MPRSLACLALAFALAGCAPAPATPRAVLRIAALPVALPAAVAPGYTAGPRVVVQLRAPGTAARGLRAAVPRLTIDDVDYVEVELYAEDPTPARALASLQANCREGCGIEPLATHGPIARADLGEPVVFGGLAPGVTYYLLARAYRDAEEGDPELISASDGAADTSFGVDSNGFASVVLPIQLKDVPFSAAADVAVPGIVAGGYADPAEAEAISTSTTPL